MQIYITRARTRRHDNKLKVEKISKYFIHTTFALTFRYLNMFIIILDWLFWKHLQKNWSDQMSEDSFRK